MVLGVGVAVVVMWSIYACSYSYGAPLRLAVVTRYKTLPAYGDHQCETLGIPDSRTRQGNSVTSAMSQLVYFLLLATVGICWCADVKEMPMPEEGGRFRRGPEDNWPAIYPREFSVHGGVYPSHSNGNWMASDQIYNDRPVYRGGTSNWAIYFRTATNSWVLDFNGVDETWAGTVATQKTLFSSEV